MVDFSFADILCALDDLNSPVSEELHSNGNFGESVPGVINFEISDSAECVSPNTSNGSTPRPRLEADRQHQLPSPQRASLRIVEFEELKSSPHVCVGSDTPPSREQSPRRTKRRRSFLDRKEVVSTRSHGGLAAVPESENARSTGAAVLSNGNSPTSGKRTFARPHRISFDIEDDVYEENPSLRSISLTSLPSARTVRVSLENVKSIMEAEHFGDVYEKLCVETSRNRPVDCYAHYNFMNSSSLLLNGSIRAGTADISTTPEIPYYSDGVTHKNGHRAGSDCHLENNSKGYKIAELSNEWNDMDAMLIAPSIEITLAAEEADSRVQRSALIIKQKELRSASVKISKDCFERVVGEESRVVTSIFKNLTNSIELELYSVDCKERERLRLIAQKKAEAEAAARRKAAAEKRTQEEAERKRIEVAAAQKRAEEEAWRAAEEARRIADEAAKRLAVEEQQRKAAAAAKAAEEDRQRAEAEVAKRAEAEIAKRTATAAAAVKQKETSTSAGAAVNNVHLRQALATKAELQIVEDTQLSSITASTHPPTKTYRVECARGLQKPLNCAATNMSTLERGTAAIIELLRKAKAVPPLISTDGSNRQMSAFQFAGYKFCNIMFQFCDRGEQISTNPQSVWSYATIATTVVRHEPELRETLFAMFFHRSMYSFPHFYPKTKTTPLLDLQQLRGQRAQEGEVHFFMRMASIVKLQHAVLVNLQDWDGLWSWYARLSNLPCRRVSVFLMWAALGTSAHDLLRMYPVQFPKVLTFVRDEFLPRIQEVRRRTPEGDVLESLKLHIHNVQSFAANYFATGRLEKPSGQSIPREISEIRDDI
eukprot:Lankesteria_metandrocarpae@DN5274_c1_g2_i4.p1